MSGRSGWKKEKNPRTIYLPSVEMGLRKGILLNPPPNSSFENP
jgi:hypothetical protein